ncbi:zinc finger protein 883-like isoform X2 [Aricia agestis]|uniref:zinc finger protein 883-like isoform X2 n=1 Tax=Aricia agestis TaxID=91739 RepID=UPI001C20298E|nr:zinc finger protein 883-like isoform X2 [Aricia agestis]
MSGIWNLSSICRFCHTDGNFRNFTLPNKHNGINESYGEILQKTFNITMIMPEAMNTSNMICDDCISSLTDAAKFKDQVQACENKFREYVKNEFFTLASDVKDSFPLDIKIEENDKNNHREVKLEFEFDETSLVKIEKSSICEEDEDDTFDQDNNDEGHTPDENIMTVELDLTAQEKVDVIKKDLKNLMITNSMKKKIRKRQNKNAVKSNITACCICFENLSKIEFPKHLETHKGPYRCKYCQKKLNKYDTLSLHIKKEHKQIKKLYTCNFCQKSCKTEKSLFYHLDRHTIQKVFDCDICHSRLKDRSVMLKHMRTHDPDRLDKTHECPQCSWRFTSKTHLNNHIKIVHERIRNYPCTSCARTFGTKKNLESHFRTHTNERPYKCEICPKSFRVLAALKKHESCRHSFTRVIGGEMEYKCNICSVKFDHKGLYMDHLKTHHEASSVCDQCGLVLSCDRSLARHRLTHAQPRFTCDTCGRKFRYKMQLARHVKSHLKEVEKSECKVCGKLVVYLKQHLHTHNRRFRCDMCDKSYSERAHLTRHLRDVHSDYKLYGCDVCGKRYTHKKGLVTHKLKCRNNKL